VRYLFEFSAPALEMALHLLAAVLINVYKIPASSLIKSLD
jgi:hypothetical protein